MPSLAIAETVELLPKSADGLTLPMVATMPHAPLLLHPLHILLIGPLLWLPPAAPQAEEPDVVDEFDW